MAGSAQAVELIALTEPERMFGPASRANSKTLLVASVPTALSEIRIYRRYVHDECDQMKNHKIKWTVKNSGLNWVGFTFTIGQLRAVDQTSLVPGGVFISDNLTIEARDEGARATYTFLKIGIASAEWGDKRIGQALIADIQRVAAFLAETDDSKLTELGFDARIAGVTAASRTASRPGLPLRALLGARAPGTSI